MTVLKVKHSILLGLLLTLLMICGQAQAATVDIDGTLTEIGDLDLFTGDTTYLKTPTEEEEVTWLNTVLGTTYTVDDVVKTEVADGDFIAVTEDPVDLDDTFVFTSEILEADYFIIKTKDSVDKDTGEIQDNIFLFDNNDLLSYAYIDITFLLLNYDIAWSDIDTISHITTAVSAVPIPAAAWLFGSALLGMVGIARRKTA